MVSFNLTLNLIIDLQDYFKVNFVFLNGNPIFSHRQSTEREILHLVMTLPNPFLDLVVKGKVKQ